MARQNLITAVRTTRANLDAQAAANNLFQGEQYYITDEKKLAVGDSASAYTVVNTAASGGGGTTFTTGTGLVLDSNNVLKIDDAKVARKDVAQTFAGDQTFSGSIYTNDLRTSSSEGQFNLYAGYVGIQSEYGIQIGNGNAQVNFDDSVNFNSDVYYGGYALEDRFLGRFSIYQDLTASFTLAVYMSERTTRLTSASASTITIPTNANANIEIGSRFSFQRGGTGAVSFVPQSGVTLEVAGGVQSIPERYGIADLVKTGTNTWSIIARAPIDPSSFVVKGIKASIVGTMTASEKVLVDIAAYGGFFATDSSNIAKAQTAATTATTLTVKRNGTSVGTITFAAAATLGTVSWSSTPVSYGDLITIEGPSTATTLADIAILLRIV